MIYKNCTGGLLHCGTLGARDKACPGYHYVVDKAYSANCLQREKHYSFIKKFGYCWWQTMHKEVMKQENLLPQ
jgi:hypothetical protein